MSWVNHNCLTPLFPGSVGVVLCLDNDDAIEFITLEVNPPPILYTLLADLASKLSLWYADTYVFGVISIGDFKLAPMDLLLKHQQVHLI